MSPEPSARDYLLRSFLHLGLGRDGKALDDLHRAADRDASDTLVIRALMAHGRDPRGRAEAAEALLANERATDADVAAAIQLLLALGQEPVVKVRRYGASVSGWVARRGAGELVISARSETVEAPIQLCAAVEPWCPPALGCLARFTFEADPREAVEITLRAPGHPAKIVNTYPALAPVWIATSTDGNVERDGVDVIVPVYGDAALTEACLMALADQRTSCPVRYWIVDDHSPDPHVSALAARFALRPGATLIVNRVNHGFAGSVNRALMMCPRADVLLLNSDVILPPGGLRRLIDAAHSDPDIGTVMPMSNDSAFTSFPAAYRANAVCGRDVALAIDAAAERANKNGVVDVANTIGFCLYIKRDCLAATGLLSQAYGRGYYEDVDFSLKARERGFRSVAATGLYVSHASGRSFRRQKNWLVASNVSILDRRYRNYALRCATYVGADPLRKARSAIEEDLPPSRPTHLLIGRSAFDCPALARRAKHIDGLGGSALLLCWAGGEIRMRIATGFGPHSLHFPTDASGFARLARYLLAADLAAIEIDETSPMPDALSCVIRDCGAPLVAVVGSLESARRAAPEDGRAPTPRAIRPVIALDALAQAYLGARAAEAPRGTSVGMPPAVKNRSSPVRIGIVVPQPQLAVDALLLRLGRGLGAPGSPTMIALGACVDDRPLMATQRIHVTGPIDFDHYADAIDDHAIDGLFSPYRTSCFGFLDELARETKLAKAYFDWSGRCPRSSDQDLVMEHELPDEAVSQALAAWCRPMAEA